MTSSDLCILVVDDDTDVLFATSRLLKKAGYNIIEARTGQEAIHLALSHHPDLILLDVVLPDIHGLDVCKKLKEDERTSNIHICLVSGIKVKSVEQSQGLEIGADDYIIRPIENRELLARINAMIRLINTEKELLIYQTKMEAMVEEATAELKKAIKNLRLSESKLRMNEKTLFSILNNTRDGVVRIDREHRHVFANSAIYETTGLTPEAYLGKTNREIGMPKDLCVFWYDKHEYVFRTGKTETFEFRFNTARNGERIFQAVVSPEFDDSGAVGSIISFMRDITDLKRIESEKDKAIERLANALSEVKTLRGLIPICSHCKNIRNDKGYWENIEAYLVKNSDVKLSHGICKECAKKYYPELGLYEDE